MDNVYLNVSFTTRVSSNSELLLLWGVVLQTMLKQHYSYYICLFKILVWFASSSLKLLYHVWAGSWEKAPMSMCYSKDSDHLAYQPTEQNLHCLYKMSEWFWLNKDHLEKNLVMLYECRFACCIVSKETFSHDAPHIILSASASCVTRQSAFKHMHITKH